MPPLSLLIKPVSGLCNMRCRYCFYTDVAQNRCVEHYGIMTDEVLTQLVKTALADAQGSCTFVFQGGEPTLAGLGFYRRLIELQQEHNVHGVQIFNSVQTNGYTIDEEWAKFFAEHHFLVGLSLDGPKDVHNYMRQNSAGEGTFDRVMEAVKLFNRYKVEYNILTVVNKRVAENAKAVYSFFRSRGFRYLQFIECIDPFDSLPRDYSLTAKDLEQFLKTTFDEYYKDFQKGQYISVRGFDNYISMLMTGRAESCGMNGVCSAYHLIEANGDVYPCDFYVLDRYRMGNIMTHTLGELSASPIAREFVRESYPIREECRRCKWYPLCHGGCRRNREPFVNGKPGLNRFCEAYKGFFEYAYPRMESMARSIIKKNQQT